MEQWRPGPRMTGSASTVFTVERYGQGVNQLGSSDVLDFITLRITGSSPHE